MDILKHSEQTSETQTVALIDSSDLTLRQCDTRDVKSKFF